MLHVSFILIGIVANLPAWKNIIFRWIHVKYCIPGSIGVGDVCLCTPWIAVRWAHQWHMKSALHKIESGSTEQWEPYSGIFTHSDSACYYCVILGLSPHWDLVNSRSTTYYFHHRTAWRDIHNFGLYRNPFVNSDLRSHLHVWIFPKNARSVTKQTEQYKRFTKISYRMAYKNKESPKEKLKEEQYAYLYIHNWNYVYMHYLVPRRYFQDCDHDLLEVFFPNEFTTHCLRTESPMKWPIPRKLNDIQVPIFTLAHVTHNTEASEICRDFANRKFGKILGAFDGRPCGESFRQSQAEPGYFQINADEAMLPGYYSWWGIFVLIVCADCDEKALSEFAPLEEASTPFHTNGLIDSHGRWYFYSYFSSKAHHSMDKARWWHWAWEAQLWNSCNCILLSQRRGKDETGQLRVLL